MSKDFGVMSFLKDFKDKSVIEQVCWILAVPIWGPFAIAFALLWLVASPFLLLGWLFNTCSHGVRTASDCPACKRERAAQQEQMRVAQEQEQIRLQAARKEEELRREEEKRELIRLQEAEAQKLSQLSYLQSLDPIKFEEIVLLAFKNLGWQTEGTKASGDGGVDGYLRKDGNLFILQCKRYGDGTRVGVGIIRELLGTVVMEKAAGGILVTTSSFTPAALKSAEGDNRLELCDGEATLKLIGDAFPAGTLMPKEHLSTCPWCGKPTTRKESRRGPFTGCSGYPKCKWASFS